MTVVILLADGVRPDTLESAIASGQTSALARLRAEGSFHSITSCFPSVTGPAYTPFLMGRFPGPVGLPGLRWFDRDRTTCTFPDYSRSYVSSQVNLLDTDLDPTAPTIFDLCETALASMTPLARGLDPRSRIGKLTLKIAWRAARTHFSGNIPAWLDIDRESADIVVDRIRRDRPQFTFAALLGIDKTSHAVGQPSTLTDQALQIVDDMVARIRADAERDGRWSSMHLWVTSDHGHSPVTTHEDLVGVVSNLGFRAIAHPWVYGWRPEVAVMVSGNAMAHLYVDIASRDRTAWTDRPSRYRVLADRLLERPSVDLLMIPTASGVIVRSAARGSAEIAGDGGRFSYRRAEGDPLGIGRDLCKVSADEAYDATIATDYPDAIVQIAHLGGAPRSGEIILSAARLWDFRAKNEPIPHVSSHGALHREHMLVPLLTNRRLSGIPRRTTDVMPSALVALGLPVPQGLDGRSFV